MAMGRESDRQSDLMVTWAEMPRSPGHVFYDRLQEVLIAGGFDGFVETACQPYYAPKMGAPSVPPGRYFRMHMVGYFEGICSERGIAWRCSDSMSLRDFLRLENREKVPDHSWLSKTRVRLPHEIHEKVFGWVLYPVPMNVTHVGDSQSEADVIHRGKWVGVCHGCCDWGSRGLRHRAIARAGEAV